MTNIEKPQQHNAEKERARAQFMAAVEETLEHLQRTREGRQMILGWLRDYGIQSPQEQH